MTWQEDIQVKITARRAAEALGKTIVEFSDDIASVIDLEVRRRTSEEFGKVLNGLHEAKVAIEANPRKNPRRFILRVIDNLSNRLSAISAGYAAGSLPKRTK